jgi:hypothetical protein
MTKMQKRWTINPNRPKPAVATPVEDRIARRPGARRTRQRLNLEFGRALKLRGAVKRSRLRKLTVLAGDVPGYVIPEAALTAQGQL